MRVSNKNCRALVQRHQTFTGSHLFSIRENGFYVVYSYGLHWPLWAFDGTVWYENTDRYSVSTGRQKSQSNPGFPTFKCGAQELKRIIAGGVYKNTVAA